jgi:hypothetical protein
VTLVQDGKNLTVERLGARRMCDARVCHLEQRSPDLFGNERLLSGLVSLGLLGSPLGVFALGVLTLSLRQLSL